MTETLGEAESHAASACERVNQSEPLALPCELTFRSGFVNTLLLSDQPSVIVFTWNTILQSGYSDTPRSETLGDSKRFLISKKN